MKTFLNYTILFTGSAFLLAIITAFIISVNIQVTLSIIAIAYGVLMILEITD
tara:strand:- start:1258 stop:1413 length:156 start_codon:yes stop_codon:yes gene_type:complete